MIAVFPYPRGNTVNAGNRAASQGSALFLGAHQAREHGERIGAPVPSVPLPKIEREHGKRLLHKAVLRVPSVPPENTGGQYAY
jgi:hypothetical protein